MYKLNTVCGVYIECLLILSVRKIGIPCILWSNRACQNLGMAHARLTLLTPTRFRALSEKHHEVLFFSFKRIKPFPDYYSCNAPPDVNALHSETCFIRFTINFFRLKLKANLFRLQVNKVLHFMVCVVRKPLYNILKIFKIKVSPSMCICICIFLYLFYQVIIDCYSKTTT